MALERAKASVRFRDVMAKKAHLKVNELFDL